MAKEPLGEYERKTTMQTTDAGARAYHIYGGASTLAQDLMRGSPSGKIVDRVGWGSKLPAGF